MRRRFSTCINTPASCTTAAKITKHIPFALLFNNKQYVRRIIKWLFFLLLSGNLPCFLAEVIMRLRFNYSQASLCAGHEDFQFYKSRDLPTYCECSFNLFVNYPGNVRVHVVSRRGPANTTGLALQQFVQRLAWETSRGRLGEEESVGVSWKLCY